MELGSKAAKSASVPLYIVLLILCPDCPFMNAHAHLAWQSWEAEFSRCSDYLKAQYWPEGVFQHPEREQLWDRQAAKRGKYLYDNWP